MKRVVEKLKCRRGASILLALLFLLVCVLVAMSVLMAAVSNAGKIRSNREEQQKYFTLSSALNLVVGELEKAEYRGQYTIETKGKSEPKKDLDGNPIVKQKEDGTLVTPEDLANPNIPQEEKYEMQHYTEYSGGQEKGKFTCGLNEPLGTLNVLSLEDELDNKIFQKKYQLPSVSFPDRWEPPFQELNFSGATWESYKLEVKVDSPPTDSPKLGQTVLVEVTVTDSGDILLTARLEDDEYISMEARLTAIIESDAFKLEVGTPDANGVVPTQQTGSVKWKLDKITKKKEAAGP